ncbi:MAG: hypothetical protein U0798_03240 [Gemmataceae bacterium]
MTVKEQWRQCESGGFQRGGNLAVAHHADQAAVEVKERACRIAASDVAVRDEQAPFFGQHPPQPDDRPTVSKVARGVTELQNPIAESDVGPRFDGRVRVGAGFEKAEEGEVEGRVRAEQFRRDNPPVVEDDRRSLAWTAAPLLLPGLAAELVAVRDVELREYQSVGGNDDPGRVPLWWARCGVGPRTVPGHRHYGRRDRAGRRLDAGLERAEGGGVRRRGFDDLRRGTRRPVPHLWTPEQSCSAGRVGRRRSKSGSPATLMQAPLCD